MATPDITSVPIGLTDADLAASQGRVQQMESDVQKKTKRLRRNLASAGGFNEQLQRFMQRRKPVETELKRAAEQLGDVKNPFVRRQLVRSAEDAIRGRRQNVAADWATGLQGRLQSQQLGLQAQEASLNRQIADRDAARQFAAQQYMADIDYQRQQEMAKLDIENQMDLYRRQMELEKEYGVGAFAPRGGGGGGGGGRPYYDTVTMPDGTTVVLADGQEINRFSPDWGTGYGETENTGGGWVDIVKNIGGGIWNRLTETNE